MDKAFLVAATLAALLPLAGCMDGDNKTSYVPQTHEFTLVVHAGQADLIPLYTANNNASMIDVFAITFKENSDDPQKVPGPEIRVKEGDTVILRVLNLNGLTHTLHLHGDPGKVAWESDGVDYLTQFPIAQGEEYVYTFEDLEAGTFWYHCHVDGSHHIDFGMYGAFIVEEVDPKYDFDREYVVMLDEWDNCHVHGNTEPVNQTQLSPDSQAQTDCYYRFVLDWMAQNQVFVQGGQAVNETGAVNPAVCEQLRGLPEGSDQEKQIKAALLQGSGCDLHGHSNPPYQDARLWWYVTHPVYNPTYNSFLVNGKAFPDTPVFPVREGERVLFRIINAGSFMHTWHPHGHTMVITHKDGYELPAPYKADTLAIAPGERYDYVMEMDNPGIWMIHDQMGQYAVNDNVHPGGMITCFPYDGFEGIDAFAMERSIDCNYAAVKILEARHGPHDH